MPGVIQARQAVVRNWLRCGEDLQVGELYDPPRLVGKFDFDDRPRPAIGLQADERLTTAGDDCAEVLRIGQPGDDAVSR